jgi:hypothetical protein
VNNAGYFMMRNFMISRRIHQAEDVIMTRENRHKARVLAGKPLGRP